MELKKEIKSLEAVKLLKQAQTEHSVLEAKIEKIRELVFRPSGKIANCECLECRELREILKGKE